MQLCYSYRLQIPLRVLYSNISYEYLNEAQKRWPQRIHGNFGLCMIIARRRYVRHYTFEDGRPTGTHRHSEFWPPDTG